jgi:hypothetical protein
MFEHKGQPPIPTAHFARRLALSVLVVAALLAVSLLIGMAGYHAFEGMPWLDAFLNAAMLLGGMGPVDPLKHEAAKLFAGLYALYAGLVFIISVALILTPVLHRVLHKFHVPES